MIPNRYIDFKYWKVIVKKYVNSSKIGKRIDTCPHFQGYMTTEIARVQPVYTMDFEASGHDLQSLVYNLLDTCLYNFCAEHFFIGCAAEVLKLERPSVPLNASISNEEGIEEKEFLVCDFFKLK